MTISHWSKNINKKNLKNKNTIFAIFDTESNIWLVSNYNIIISKENNLSFLLHVEVVSPQLLRCSNH